MPSLICFVPSQIKSQISSYTRPEPVQLLLSIHRPSRNLFIALSIPSASSSAPSSPNFLPLPSSLSPKMTSITTFAYGLTVRAIPLVIAAQAWPALETTFHFLDLLFLRKRTGTFRSRPFISGRDCVGSIPVEVWEEIKRWLVIAEMEDAEERIGQDVLGTDECFNTACEWWSSGRRGSTRFIDAVQKCEYCDERSWEWTVEFCEGEHGYHKVALFSAPRTVSHTDQYLSTVFTRPRRKIRSRAPVGPLHSHYPRNLFRPRMRCAACHSFSSSLQVEVPDHDLGKARRGHVHR